MFYYSAKQCVLCLVLLSFGSHSLYSPAVADEPRVTGIAAEYRHGQTFVTWKDVAEGEEGAKYRYSLYRSEKPITAENLSQAELCYHGVMNHSAKLFGHAFALKDRLDPAKPTATIVEGGKPLPLWTGLAVHTVKKPGKAFYAVVATEEKGEGKTKEKYSPVTKVVPGESATTAAVEEKVEPIQPIKLYDSNTRGVYSKQTAISGQKNLPLKVELHASQGQGGGAHDYGDYYLYFGTPEMGWRDGLPGVFSVHENRVKPTNVLDLRHRECIERLDGKGAMETFWFGYVCVPQGATHTEPRAYPFTERRMKWLVEWVINKYEADRQHVHAGGGSMGAWGSTTYAFRVPETYAVVYPNRPRTIQKGMPRLVETKPGEVVLMEDGKTTYLDRMNMVKFAAEDPAKELPFYAWCNGRRDGFASWQEQLDMVKALTEAKRGFAFAYNDGDHSSGSEPMKHVVKYYPPERFSLNKSYPALGNSSINEDPGNGDPKAGTMVGGFNLGFSWSEAKETPTSWSIELGNDLNKADMTVDVTPRRCQVFKAKPGESFKFKTSTGATGSVLADKHGLVTLEKVVIKPGEKTTVTIEK